MGVDEKCDSEEEDEGAITYSFDDGTEEIFNAPGGAVETDNAIEDGGVVETDHNMEDNIEIPNYLTQEYITDETGEDGLMGIDDTLADIMGHSIVIPDSPVR